MEKTNECIASVLVPAYNHERYVVEALEGLYGQTFKDFQIIVTDDHSTDNTPQILLENQKRYGYELILNEKNVGISETLTNMAKNYAKGKYIFICASDDIYMPNRIEKQVEYLENHPEYAMCYARTISIDSNSREIDRDVFKGYRSGFIFEDVLLRKYNLGICVAIRADVLKDLGYYKSGVLAEDYYMNCKIAEKYKVGFIDDYLLRYRVAPLSKKRDPWKLVDSHRQTIELFSYRPEYNEALRQWRIKTAVTVAPYTKYKIKAITLMLSSFYILKNKEEFYYLLRIIKALLMRWEHIS